jgi:L,D-peptidoglycan transpeptidase YkuD (ErfK/YbiS/YcfS/YnhG family)
VEAEQKREGDGGTPLGCWPIRGVILRPGKRQTPPRLLPWRWCRPRDGWCDDPRSVDYNRPIRHPSPVSAERLWRDDDRYDAIIALGFNDAPVIADRGSAIFLHLRGPEPTAGCVAVSPDVMGELLHTLPIGSHIAIA